MSTPRVLNPAVSYALPTLGSSLRLVPERAPEVLVLLPGVPPPFSLASPASSSRRGTGVPEVLADCIATPLRYHLLRQEATDVGVFVDRRGREAIQDPFAGRPVGLAHSDIPLIDRGCCKEVGRTFTAIAKILNLLWENITAF